MVKDILIDDFGDLSFKDGDFKFGESDEQHAILIINTMAGSWKQYPTCGVGIIQYSASSGQSLALKSLIYNQLQLDGYGNIDVILKANSDDNFDYYINATRLT